VFIWNCFDQIENPQSAFRECRRVLKRHGLLTVRTPDGEFYALCEKLLNAPELTAESEQFVLRTVPEEPAWVEQEEKRISTELGFLENSVFVHGGGTSIGPWVEAWFRAS
jgi:ubiquinone/menaquinone biosynthesis C-methylase UbiE